jgi:hypothetical protein
MPWGYAAVAVGSIAAASMSSDAANNAADTQAASADAATALQREQYNQTRADQAPYRALASDVALPGIRNFLTTNNNQITSDQVLGDPGYKFGLSQGNKNIQGSAAARGGLYSGATLKALNKFGNDYGTTKFNDTYNRMETARNNQFNRYATAAGIGQVANNQVAQAGQSYATNAGSNLIGAGNAQAAAGIGSSNAWANALNSGVSSYGRSGGGFNYGSNPNNQGAGSNFWNGFSDSDVMQN